MRIVVTDSGLGGLSVVAELERRLNENPIYTNGEIIFFNSLYSHEYGYNLMSELNEKTKVFNNALNSMVDNYNPDIILMACNTLSVVYPHTKFAKDTKTKVKGIVDSGIDLFNNNLSTASSNIILFGTSTTINSNVYKNALLKNGIDETQIINQTCLDLETEIQNNPSSMETRKLITNFVSSAINGIKNNTAKTYAGLCCTHYGYSEQIFFDELSKQLSSEVKILNPNSKMLDFLFSDSTKPIVDSKINVEVVSQVKLRKNEIASLAKIIRAKSPKTATALENYSFIRNLFSKE